MGHSRIKKLQRQLRFEFLSSLNKANKHLEIAKFKLDDMQESLKLVEKHKKIIDETLNDYNYKGFMFKTAYLPIVIGLALEKYSNKLKDDLTIFDESEDDEEDDEDDEEDLIEWN